MPLSTWFRRRRLPVLAALLVAGAALWIGHFLATFDLNHYRDELAAGLGERLGMPVQLGEAHVELREAGIALRFSELQAGDAGTRFELHADTLWLQLAWRGLLLRKPLFSEMTLAGPRLRVSPQPAPGENGGAVPTLDLDLLRDLKVRRVEIQRGTLELAWNGAAGTVHVLRLDNLDVSISDLGRDRDVSFDISARLADHPGAAGLAVSGSFELPAAGSWLPTTWDCTVQAKEVDAGRLASLLPEHVPLEAAGAADLTLFTRRQVADSAVTIQAEVVGRKLRVRPNAAYPQAVPLEHLQAAGTWQREADRHQFRQLAIRLDDLRLAGEVSVEETTEGLALHGAASNCTLPLDDLRRWLPQALAADNPLLARLQPGGVLTLETAAFRGGLPASSQLAASFHLEALTGEAKGLSWLVGETRRIELAAVDLSLAGREWRFNRGMARFAGLPVGFSGSIATGDAPGPRLTLALDSQAPASEMAALWAESLPANLSVAGTLRLRAHLAGTLEQLSVAAHADLAQLEVRYGDVLQLPATAGAALTVQGQGTPTALSIERATLSYAPLTASLAGTIDWTETWRAALTGSVETADLAALHPLVPAFAKLQPRGGAALELVLNGPMNAMHPRASLELRGVGIPMRGMVADITALNGRLQLDGRTVYSDRLTARIGKSPATLRARVADLGAPRLELEIAAPAVRADELIFYSDRTILREVQGRLVIDRDSLLFDPVKVRLDKGTRATVNGSVRNFAEPRIDLEITGDYANVEEIIGLWTDASPEARAAHKRRDDGTPRQPLPPIRIAAKAARGDLYGMEFADARALIVPTSGRLLIHPLDFEVGKGYCTSQVRVDFHPTANVLRISGHAEDVDAFAIYNQLLGRKSIMRGSLRGDFYLQGELGGRGFLPTAYGNISTTVRDGVMRHSPVLSTVFSLLNVSQLFSFKLPDVNLEGLPFTGLSAELAIERGVISTEHLVIDSDAMDMSYTGQFDLVKNELDLLAVVKPLGTIDKVVTRLPIAGWILGGDEKALITVQLRITGPGDKPDVEAIPISAMSKGVLGIFQRTLSLPLKLVEDPAILWGGGGEKGEKQ